MMKKYQAVIKILAIIIFVMVILKLCLIFLWPFLIAILLSFLLEPIVRIFNNLGMPRKLSVGLSIFSAFALIIIVTVYLSNYMYNQTISFSQNITSILTVLDKKFRFLDIHRLNYGQFLKTLQEVLLSYKTKIFETIITTFNGILYTIIIFMSTLFISIDMERFVKFIKRISSENVYRILNNISVKIGKIIRVELMLILITTGQTVIGLYILGINNSLTIGIICGILDILPIVGPAIIFIPLVIYEIIINKIFVGVGLILLFILLQISREVMKIKFVGQNLDIHPITTIISLYLGVLFYGLWGIILGPFMVILIIELLNEYYGGSRFFKL